MVERITPDLLVAAVGCTRANAERFAPHLAEACRVYAIDTPARVAAFLAQLGHESVSLAHVVEVWGPTPAQERYEGRADLGNTEPGDGLRYRGHGLIQVTGRANHARARNRLRARFGPEVPDFEADPQALQLDRWAALSAGDFWDANNLNALADAGNFESITRRINGGLNGQADRLQRWQRASAALDVRAGAPAPIETRDIPTEAPMPIPAIIGALLPSLIDAVPKLAGIFKPGSEVAERNVAAAGVAFDIAKRAIDASNEQDVIERIKTDPAAATTVRQAVEAEWFKLVEAGGGGIEGARKADAAAIAGDVPWWNVFRSPSFLVACLLMPLVYMIVGAVVGLWGNPFSDEVRSAIANGIPMLILGGLIGYYYGQTTSRNRAPGA